MNMECQSRHLSFTTSSFSSFFLWLLIKFCERSRNTTGILSSRYFDSPFSGHSCFCSLREKTSLVVDGSHVRTSWVISVLDFNGNCSFVLCFTTTTREHVVFTNHVFRVFSVTWSSFGRSQKPQKVFFLRTFRRGYRRWQAYDSFAWKSILLHSRVSFPTIRSILTTTTCRPYKGYNYWVSVNVNVFTTFPPRKLISSPIFTSRDIFRVRVELNSHARMCVSFTVLLPKEIRLNCWRTSSSWHLSITLKNIEVQFRSIVVRRASATPFQTNV